jgi:hypothetical protein
MDVNTKAYRVVYSMLKEGQLKVRLPSASSPNEYTFSGRTLKPPYDIVYYADAEVLRIGADTIYAVGDMLKLLKREISLAKLKS